MTSVAKTNKSKSNNIKVLTYNISWETTKPHRDGDFKRSPMIKPSITDIVKKCRKDVDKCRSNIAGVIKSKQSLDFIALQEVPFQVPPPGATDFDPSNLIDITNQWDAILRISPNDYYIFNHTESVASMKVYVSKKKYTLLTKPCGGALPGIGRPFLAIFVQSNITKENIAFINIHAGHFSQNDSLNISGPIEKSCGRWLTRMDRYIMAGDFNRDITNTGNQSITLNNIQLYNKRFPRPSTCCSNDASRRHFRPSDHILDSKGLFNNYTSGEGAYPSSDHAWIYAELGDSSPKKSLGKVKIQTSAPKSIRYNKNDNYYLQVSMDIKTPNDISKVVESTNTINNKTSLNFVCGQVINSNGKNFQLVEYKLPNTDIYILGYIQSKYIQDNIVTHPKNSYTRLRQVADPKYKWSLDYAKKFIDIKNGESINFPCNTRRGGFIAVYDVSDPNLFGYAQTTHMSGGKKVRKHQGIIQTGGNVGRLRKGYRYSGKKLKSGLPQIIKCKSKKC